MASRSNTLNRRSFLKSAAGAGLAAPYVITSSALGAEGVAAASERVTMGFIGVGGMGNGNLGQFLKLPNVQVVAVCDTWEGQRKKTKARIDGHYAAQSGRVASKGCDTYVNFRELLARKDIDAVCIATPDHWHALIAIEAARAGKDMYVEKPMDVTITQGRAMVNAMKQYGRLFQHGTQQRSSREFRFACELVRNRRIGELRLIKVGAPASIAGPPVKPAPVPKELDYEMWLGPAPSAPYQKERCALGSWYHICDYSIGGFIGGWGIHHVDIAQWGNDTENTGPIEIEGGGNLPASGLYDAPTSYRFECLYANGVKMIFADNKQNEQGTRFEGDEGWVYVRRGHIDAHPKSLLKEKIGPNEKHVYKSDDHRKNLIDCIKTREPTIAPVEVAHRSTTICSLGHIALRTGAGLKWDPKKERFTNHDAANRMLERPMRSPWHL